MNNEPVAWMYETELQNGTTVKRVTGAWELKYKYIVDACDRGKPIPLYTHPADLTDEEILEELLIPKSEWDSYKAHHCLKQIRAILRKAQEK